MAVNFAKLPELLAPGAVRSAGYLYLTYPQSGQSEQFYTDLEKRPESD
jgi:hypothetical protein